LYLSLSRVAAPQETAFNIPYHTAVSAVADAMMTGWFFICENPALPHHQRPIPLSAKISGISGTNSL
jgi:hypothetical protein